MYSWLEIEDKIKAVSAEHDLDWMLVKAFVITESSGETGANRYEPGWRWFLNPKDWARRLRLSTKTEWINQATSFGLMQVVGTVARELGFKGHIPELVFPELGLKYGCLKLKDCIRRYPTQLELAIASYNAGSPRYFMGKLINQSYVNKIMSLYNSFKEE